MFIGKYHYGYFQKKIKIKVYLFYKKGNLEMYGFPIIRKIKLLIRNNNLVT